MTCLLCHEKIQRRFLLEQWLTFYPICQPCLCQNCQRIIEEERFKGDSCYVCQKGKDKKVLCADCLNWRARGVDPKFRVWSAYRYEGMIKESLLQLKMKGDVRFERILSPIFKEELKVFKDKIFVPIPSNRERKRQRGFNPVAYLLEKAGLAYVPLLESKQMGDGQMKQAYKSRQERLASENPFQLNEDLLKDISDRQGKSILLIDDVYTTGATMHHALELLENRAFQSIAAWVLARA